MMDGEERPIPREKRATRGFYSERITASVKEASAFWLRTRVPFSGPG